MNSIETLKKEQEKHRQQMKENRDKVLAQKKRTHRLIVRGAIAESLIENAPQLSDAEFKKVLQKMINKDV